jgi:hypothetical protein
MQCFRSHRVASTLAFPDGIRLTHKDEIPGPEPERAATWSRVQLANIAPGFLVKESNDHRFSFYAEANVDAPRMWAVFSDLCRGLIGPVAALVMSELDQESTHIGTASTSAILSLLEPHAYQLANDGWIQFGLIEERRDSITEVFVATTKHFEVWLNDEKLFRSIMQGHALSEVDQLEFLDEYPRTTIRLPADRVLFYDHTEFIEHFMREIGELSSL